MGCEDSKRLTARIYLILEFQNVVFSLFIVLNSVLTQNRMGTIRNSVTHRKINLGLFYTSKQYYWSVIYTGLLSLV